MNFIKIDNRHINTEQIVSISENEDFYELRMSNADAYFVNKKDKECKKIIQGVLNADIQLSSKRTTERTDRSIQRPAK